MMDVQTYRRIIKVCCREALAYFHGTQWRRVFVKVLALTLIQMKLSLSFFQDLLSVHDSVAQNDYEPRLPSLPADDDEEDSVRIIHMMKVKEPLVSLSGALKYLPALTLLRRNEKEMDSV